MNDTALDTIKQECKEVIEIYAQEHGFTVLPCLEIAKLVVYAQYDGRFRLVAFNGEGEYHQVGVWDKKEDAIENGYMVMTMNSQSMVAEIPVSPGAIKKGQELWEKNRKLAEAQQRMINEARRQQMPNNLKRDLN